MNRRSIPCCVFVLLVLVGCSDHGTEPPSGGGGSGTTTVSYAADVQPIWTANCTVCHGAGGNAGLDLRMPDSRTHLVDVDAVNWPGKLVVADESDQSVLYLKLMGAPGVGDRMPQGGVLGTGALETVRRWIVEGALDN
ncbi:hypothetical protein DRQ50_12680 [bacterium]|nr:MAG: hypothetical protein DRQ50_12680 [bacterium]